MYYLLLIIVIPIQFNEVNSNFVMNLPVNYKYLEHAEMTGYVSLMIIEGFMIILAAGLTLFDLMEMLILPGLLKMNVKLIGFELDSMGFDSHEMLPLNI